MESNKKPKRVLPKRAPVLASMGLKNAEKWNEETMPVKLAEIKKLIQNDSTIYTLSAPLSRVGLYSEWWSHMTIKFKENHSISQSIKEIEAMIEARIINDTMTGTARSSALSIFLLKNKYGYVDKVETDNTQNVNVNSINLKDLISFDD